MNWRKLIIVTAGLSMAPCLVAQQSAPNTGYPLSGVQRHDESGQADGLLNYDLRFSQTFTTGLNFGSTADKQELISTEAVSGDMYYGHQTERGQLLFHYSGGAAFNSRINSHNTTYHTLEFSDSFAFKKFTFVAADTASYSPEGTLGGAGIPGIGNIGSQLGLGNLGLGIVPGQNVLFNYSPRISNAVVGETDYNFSQRTALTGSASYGLLRSLDFGIDSNQFVYSGGLSHQLTARNSAAVNYQASHVTYVGSQVKMNTKSIFFQFSRVWSHSIRTEASFGPQHIVQELFPGSERFFPGRTILATSLSAFYTRNHDDFNARFTRSSNAGSGILVGALSNIFSAGVTHQFSRLWSAGLDGSYVTNNGLTSSRHTKFTTKLIGVQANRRFSEHLSAYASYTYRDQNTSMVLSDQVLQGNSNVFGIGFDLTPRGLRIKGH